MELATKQCLYSELMVTFWWISQFHLCGQAVTGVAYGNSWVIGEEGGL